MAPTLLVPPAVDDATRRRFLGMMAAAGLLTACSGDPAPAPTDPGFPRTVTTPDDGPVRRDRTSRRIDALAPLLEA